MQTETWKPITGFEGRYDVSDLGRVRSWVSTSKPSPRILQTSSNRGRSGRPYQQVSLSLGKRRSSRSVKVHRLVSEAFHGPRPAGLETRHLDGDFTNNRADNLEYGTPSQNRHDQITHGTHPWQATGLLPMPQPAA